MKRYGVALSCLIIGVFLTLIVFFNTNVHGNLAEIVRVEHISTAAEDDEYHNHDQEITQRLTLKILSSPHHNKRYKVTNTYNASQLINQPYYLHQRVFISLNNQQVTISNLKRDWVLVLMITLCLSLLFAILPRRGGFVVGSLIINTLIFYFILKWDVAENATHTILIYGVAAFLFAASSFLLYQGWHLKTFVMLLSSITALMISFGICYLTMKVTHESGINYTAMEYATQSPESLFLGQSILGVLGAVMDEVTDLTSSLNEIILHHPTITYLKIWQSGRSMGKDIMGPLINVLVLIFMAGALPMTILYFRNNNNLAYTFQFTLSLGLIQSIMSAIGIVLTVPIASIGAFLLKPKKEAIAHDN